MKENKNRKNERKQKKKKHTQTYVDTLHTFTLLHIEGEET